jgi:hypothetical protein
VLDDASAEAIRRQAVQVRMRQMLTNAQAALHHADVDEAARLYDHVVQLGRELGSLVAPEMRQAVSGVLATRTFLAERAQRRNDYVEADLQIRRMLVVSPKHPEVLELKKENDAGWARSRNLTGTSGRTNRIRAASLVQDGRLLYEEGRWDEARAKLVEAAGLDPENKLIPYYLELVSEGKHAQVKDGRNEATGPSLAITAQFWEVLRAPGQRRRTELQALARAGVTNVIVSVLSPALAEEAPQSNRLALVLSEAQLNHTLGTLGEMKGASLSASSRVATASGGLARIRAPDRRYECPPATRFSTNLPARPIQAARTFPPDDGPALLYATSAIQADGKTIRLKVTGCLMEFIGFDSASDSTPVRRNPGQPPPARTEAPPGFRRLPMEAAGMLAAGQTLLIEGGSVPAEAGDTGGGAAPPLLKDLLVLLTPVLTEAAPAQPAPVRQEK